MNNKLDEIINSITTIIELINMLYKDKFALTVSNTKYCVYSMFNKNIDFGFRIGSKVLPHYGSYKCMQSKKIVRLITSTSYVPGEKYLVYSQPIIEDEVVLGSVNLITYVEDEELAYNIRKAINLRDKGLGFIQSSNDTSVRLIGTSSIRKKMLKTIEKVKKYNNNVLITGDSGTGKGVVAKMIHYTSNKKNEPFIHINCASIQPNLIESEFFGHEKGSFTGANNYKKGKFEIAGNGTIFLDEINSLNLDFQAKLLHVVQEKKAIRVGSNIPYNIHARIIAATNEDLEELIKQNKFRKDLYYRLNIIKIECPPLKSRKEDIDSLITHFIKTASETLLKPNINISPIAVKALRKYDWPGNIRELENAIESSIVLSDNNTIDLQDLPPRIAKQCLGSNTTYNNDNNVYYSFLEIREMEAIKNILEKHHSSRKKAAEELGISKRTLYYKLKKYNIK